MRHLLPLLKALLNPAHITIKYGFYRTRETLELICPPNLLLLRRRALLLVIDRYWKQREFCRNVWRGHINGSFMSPASLLLRMVGTSSLNSCIQKSFPTLPKQCTLFPGRPILGGINLLCFLTYWLEMSQILWFRAEQELSA